MFTVVKDITYKAFAYKSLKHFGWTGIDSMTNLRLQCTPPSTMEVEDTLMS